MGILDFLIGIKAREDAFKPDEELTEEDLIADIIYWQEQGRQERENKKKK